MSAVDTDLQAVRAVRRGNRNAFRALVDRNGRVVHSVLLRLVGCPELAEELTQETFVRAYTAIGEFRAESRVRTWLLQIGVNLVRDRLRLEKRKPVLVSMDQGDPGAAESRGWLADGRADPVRAIEQEELASRLERELARLPEAYREVFILKHVEGLPYEEIARVTGDTVGSLKVRAHRTRRLLRERLAAAGGQTEVRHGRHPRKIHRR